MLITPTKNATVHYKSVPLHKIPLNAVTPVKDLLKLAEAGQHRLIHSPNPIDFAKRSAVRGVHAMNSTAINTDNFYRRMPCELSCIAAEGSSPLDRDSVFFPVSRAKNVALVSESPAKIFARMKAKVQKQNLSTGQRAAAQSWIAARQQQDVLYRTPRKTRLNGVESQESQHSIILTEALVLSPNQTPDKVQRLHHRESPRKDTQYAGTQAPVSCRAPKPSSCAKQLEWLIPAQSRVESPGAHARGEMRFERRESSNVICQDQVFAVPDIPSKRTAPGITRKDSAPRNSPAKIFALMKERVVLRRWQQQELGQVTSTADTDRRVHGTTASKREMVAMSGEEGDDELSRDVDSSVGVSSCSAAIGSAAVTSSFISALEEAAHAHHLTPPPPPEPLQDLALLQSSPRITIPKKRAAIFFQREDEAVPRSADEEPVPTTKRIHLREWKLKTQNSMLFVDGVRTDSKIPWHSNLIMERIESNVLQTISGSIYVLVGKMAADPTSPLPGWLRKKFLFGFPEKWKDDLESYLTKLKSSDSGQKRREKPGTDPTPPSKPKRRSASAKERPSKHLQTPSDPITRVQSNSAKVSRSGRLIKPPLEYWKGGRVILDSDMNVTIHEDYTSTPTTSQKSSSKMASGGLSRHAKTPEPKGSSANRRVRDRRARGTDTDASDREVGRGTASPSREQRPLGKASRAGLVQRYTVKLTPIRTSAELRERCSKNDLRYRSDPEVTGAEVTEAEVTQPGVTEAEITEVTEAEVTEVTEAEVTQPGVMEAEVTEAEVTQPGFTEAEITEAEVTEQGEGGDDPPGLKELRLADEASSESSGREEASRPWRKVKQRVRPNKKSVREEEPRGVSPSRRGAGQTRGGPAVPSKPASASRRPPLRPAWTSDTDRSPRRGIKTRSSRSSTDSSEKDQGQGQGRPPSEGSEVEGIGAPDPRRRGRNRTGRRAYGIDSEADALSDSPRELRSASRSKRGVEAAGSSQKSARTEPGKRRDQERRPRPEPGDRGSRGAPAGHARSRDSSPEAGRGRRAPDRSQESDDGASFLVPPRLFGLPGGGGKRRETPGGVGSTSREPGTQREAAVVVGVENQEQRSASERGGGMAKRRPRKPEPRVVPGDGLTRERTRDPRHTRVGKQRRLASDGSGSATPSDYAVSPDSDLVSRTGGKVDLPRNGADKSFSEKKRERRKDVRGRRREGGGTSRKSEPVEEEEEQEDDWTGSELEKLHTAVSSLPKHRSGFWVNVAMAVGTHSAEECQEQHTNEQSELLKAKAQKKKKGRPNKEEPVEEAPRITAKAGTLKRKQQVRGLLDYMPKDDHDDVFSASPLQNKRVKLPTLSTNGEDRIQHLQQNPVTPTSSAFPLVKTPHCLHISPGMLGSVNRSNNDKYVFQLQKKMGKGWANVRGPDPSSQKLKYNSTSSMKPTKRRPDAENESFAVWKMFSDKEPLPADESGEEDYYFMDDD